MVDLTITATSVVPDANSQTQVGICGETITAGQVLYLNPADNLWYKADNLTALKAGSGNPSYIRIALSGGSVGQYITLLAPGQTYTVGAAVLVGTTYVISSTLAGGRICPASDLNTADYYTVIGYATSATKILFQPNPTGLIVA